MTVSKAVFVCCLVLENALAFAGDGDRKWQALTSWSSYIEFAKTSEARIANFTNANFLDRRQILGLEITDEAPASWSSLGDVLTNVVCLRVATSTADLSTTFLSAVTNYPRLQYVHLECRHALAIPPSISLLTNLVHLRYLGIDAPSATNVDSQIYRITTLKELLLVVGAANIPDGITQLPDLTRLEIHGRRANPVRSLPADLPKCMVQRLIFANVLGIERLLPALPPGLVELNVLNCRMGAIPNGWYDHRKLQVIDLSHNELAQFPDRLLAIPSLKLLGLDLNNITVVPPLSIADAGLIRLGAHG
jgi:hypothetical protein